MSNCKRSGRVSVHCWGWISHEEAGVLHRESPGWPAVSAHFTECNGVLCTDALSWWYNPFTARPLLHSWFSCGSRMAIGAGRRRTHWLENREHLIWTPSRICGVRWKGQFRKPGLSSFQEIVMSYGHLCQTLGMKLLCLSVTFDHWLSPWHDEWNQWSKQKGSGFLIKAVNFWKQPF